MIHPLTLTSLSNSKARRLPAAWRPTLVWIGGIALCLLLALATLPRTAWSSDTLPAQAPLAAAAAPAEPPAPTPRARCGHCGVVELIRQLEPVGLLPSQYEFTVRLRDGSARVSTVVAATASAWAVGDSILLIGGI